MTTSGRVPTRIRRPSCEPLARGTPPPKLHDALFRAVDWRSLRRVDASVVDRDLRQQQADLLFAARLGDREVLLHLLLEHKAEPDRWTAFQLLRYVSASGSAADADALRRRRLAAALLRAWRALHPRLMRTPGGQMLLNQLVSYVAAVSEADPADLRRAYRSIHVATEEPTWPSPRS